MPERLDTPFEAYSFSSLEEPQAKVFTELQTLFLRTELSVYATELVQMEIAQDEELGKNLAHRNQLRGAMIAIERLLASSADSKDELNEALKDSMKSQRSE